MDYQKEYQREYYDRNRDRLLTFRRDYYDMYRVEILTKQKEKNKKSQIITCKCGRNLKAHCLYKHLNTDIHKKLLQLTNEK